MSLAPRQAYLPAILVLGIASGMVLLAAGMPWATAQVELLLGTEATQQASWTGDQLAPLLRGAGLVGLAGIAGIVATSGRGRVVVGLVLAVAGLAGVWSGIAGRASIIELASESIVGSVAGSVAGSGAGPGVGSDMVWATGWPWIAVGGCALIALIGTITATVGRLWPGMGRRYQRTSSTVDSSPWEALDHGEDPTA